MLFRSIAREHGRWLEPSIWKKTERSIYDSVLGPVNPGVTTPEQFRAAKAGLPIPPAAKTPEQEYEDAYRELERQEAKEKKAAEAAAMRAAINRSGRGPFG